MLVTYILKILPLICQTYFPPRNSIYQLQQHKSHNIKKK
uniref:Uncharacterized protein n=1 Tax=Anguilla anguilla TaxID=7936 RepID=A0A0E9R280_ANGAN